MKRLTPSDWQRLREVMQASMPFPPPFQRKDIHARTPAPASFDEDVWYHGDYGEGLDPLDTIEWIRIRPRYLRFRGHRVPREVVDCENELTSLLAREELDFTTDRGCVVLYGANPTQTAPNDD